jgi:phytoene desaturase
LHHGAARLKRAAMVPSELPITTRRACVIGAGAGGLALAIRLQAAGIATTLVEARERVGGSIQSWERKGFRFEEGPGMIPDPAPLRELWSLAGRELGEDCTLLEVNPLCRFSWPDGTTFDLSGEEGALAREVTRLAPGDLAGFEDFQRWQSHALTDGIERLAQEPQRGAFDLARALPLIARNQGWRSAYGLVAHFVKNERLREALAFPALLAGGNPMRAPAFTLLAQHVPRGKCGWWPEGGMTALAAAMAALFERLGGTVRCHDPVLELHTLGNRVHEVECQSGWREHFDAVASNADLVHTYRDLLGANPRGPEMARRLAARRFSPGLFTVHFALEGSWPGIPHRSVLMGPRYRALFADLFDHGVLPQDFVMVLDHPSVTDPTLAPPGKSVLRAAIPVANLKRLPIDWETVGTLIAKRVLAEVGRRLVPDLSDRLSAVFHRSPRDAALDLSAYGGAAWSLEPGSLQGGRLRPAARDAKIPNLFLTGAGIHPGAGLPAVLAGAKGTAKLLLESLR